MAESAAASQAASQEARPEPKIKDSKWSKDLEPPIYTQWKDAGAYRFSARGKAKVYSIDTPPPYVNTPVHIGQVTTYVLMDMFARYHRMLGENVLFPLGLDRNGLPIEMAAEKKYEKRLTELPREEAVKLCESILESASLASVESFLRCGISFSGWQKGTGIGDIYETDSPDYRALTQETFIDMWEKGLIYEDNRVNNWDPLLQTTLADAEVTYEDVPSQFNDIVFTCKETGEKLIIGTTRPELVCTCGMVIFHPDDARYRHLDGKTALTPVFNREVPIKAHPQAHMDKGTGLVMMCSFGDLADIRFFREQGITPIIAIGKNGTMNEHAGFLQGLHVKKARAAMIEKLKEQNLLMGQKQITHRTPISERSKAHIEFIAMPELYVKQIEQKETMRKIAGDLKFYDDASRKILLDWIDAVSIDWPITRRRYYATEVPLWYCEKCSAPVTPPRGKYWQPWKQKCPIKACPKCGHGAFKGDVRVFDTWFDSSITPLYILKWRRNEKFFAQAKRASLRPQGKEIVRTWLYYTLLKCHMLTGERIFDETWINYHIVDDQGHKMSKSKGNVIDPKGVLDKFGAEPFRLWAAVEGNLTGTDFRCSFDRIDGAGKTLTKLWNVARFVSMFEPAKKPKKLAALDAWLLSEANELVRLARDGYARYDFHNPVIAIRHFIWETFASHYLEMVKNRAYAGDESARYTLHAVLDSVLLTLAPVLPMLTYKAYMDLRGKDVHFEDFPSYDAKLKTASGFTKQDIMDFNAAVWKAKKDANITLKAEVKNAVAPEALKPIADDLKSTHGIRTIAFGKETKVEL